MSQNTHADAMLNAVADFIKAQGWNVVVIGSPRIQKPPGEPKFNYEFVLRFTGSPPKKETEDGNVPAEPAIA